MCVCVYRRKDSVCPCPRRIWEVGARSLNLKSQHDVTASHSAKQ